ncbi:MAG TPA: hypothetical protein VLV15_08795, partial [Dongiaceae bacterium]|nr:hypothetical protein [Dongiaceae bacterium]
VTIYICTDDESAHARDEFALTLARVLTTHVPSTLLIDCDFLHPGLGDRVPHKDALGFLDYLLYGSSIGVITQEHNGVHIVGAGSFPVTKRMPVIDTAFSDAARRLVTHARCALFVGPAFDDTAGTHPITGTVDIVATLRTSLRHAALDDAEEGIAAGGVEVWSIRLVVAPVAEAPPPAAPSPPPPPAPRPLPVQRAAVSADEAVTAARGESLAPRIAVVAFGLLVIAFVAWWFITERGAPGVTEEKPAPAHVAADSLRHAADTLATRDTVSTRAPAVSIARPDTTSPKMKRAATAPSAGPGVSAVQKKPAETGAYSGGSMLVNSADIQVMDDLDRKYHGWFMIHISSFQTS